MENKDQQFKEFNFGEVFLEWGVPEVEKHERSKAWYLIFGLFVVLMLIYSIFTANLLFAAILILASFVLIIQNFQSSLDVDIKITEKGILVGRKYYSYTALENFWFVYEPPVKKLYLNFKGTLKPHLVLSLGEVNPLKIRAILEEFIKEDLTKEGEDLNEVLARMVKI